MFNAFFTCMQCAPTWDGYEKKMFNFQNDHIFFAVNKDLTTFFRHTHRVHPMNYKHVVLVHIIALLLFVPSWLPKFRTCQKLSARIALCCVNISVVWYWSIFPMWVPENTQRNKYVIITPIHRFNVIITCLLRLVFAGVTIPYILSGPRTCWVPDFVYQTPKCWTKSSLQFEC